MPVGRKVLRRYSVETEFLLNVLLHKCFWILFGSNSTSNFRRGNRLTPENKKCVSVRSHTKGEPCPGWMWFRVDFNLSEACITGVEGIIYIKLILPRRTVDGWAVHWTRTSPLQMANMKTIITNKANRAFFLYPLLRRVPWNLYLVEWLAEGWFLFGVVCVTWLALAKFLRWMGSKGYSLSANWRRQVVRGKAVVVVVSEPKWRAFFRLRAQCCACYLRKMLDELIFFSFVLL